MKTPDAGKDTNVLSKTSEEIKKGMVCCSSRETRCRRECPYVEANCLDALIPDALALINRLEGDNIAKAIVLEQLERERDAAIEDIKKAALFLCQTCKKYHPAIVDGSKHYCDRIPADHFDDGAIACGMYEWRGVQEDNDEDA